MSSRRVSAVRVRLTSDNGYDTEGQQPVRNNELCAELRHRILMTAIQHIASNMLRILNVMTPPELVAARNRVDVPHGLFGLKMENFFIRCRESDVYLDALQMMCAKTLNKANMCIVLDDLYEYCAKLFHSFPSRGMKAVVKDIDNARKLLAIGETVLSDYKINMNTLHHLTVAVNMHNIRERKALDTYNVEIFNAQQKVTVPQIVLNPMKFRYTTNYYQAIFDQMALNTSLKVEETAKCVKDLQWKDMKEIYVSNSVQIRLSEEIEMLKEKIDDTRQMYQRDSDLYDSDIGYKKNAMLMMQSQYQDCLLKLDFFEFDKPRLIEWIENWEIWKRKEARKRLLQERAEMEKALAKKKGKGKKSKK